MLGRGNDMKFAIILVLLLGGCAHKTSDGSKEEEYGIVIRSLEYRLNYLEYESTNQKCFTLKDICEMKAEIKCKKPELLKVEKDVCWKKHERCIIDNYKRWKDVKGMFK